MGDILSNLPVIGGTTFGAVVVAIIAYLLNANRVDRKDYWTVMEAARKEAKAEREERELTEAALDKERQLRREAEATAGLADTQNKSLRFQNEAYSLRITQLEAENLRLRSDK